MIVILCQKLWFQPWMSRRYPWTARGMSLKLHFSMFTLTGSSLHTFFPDALFIPVCFHAVLSLDTFRYHAPVMHQALHMGWQQSDDYDVLTPHPKNLRV